MNSYRTEITQILCPSPGTIAIIDWQELGFMKRNSHQAPSASFHYRVNTLAATHAALLTTTTQRNQNQEHCQNAKASVALSERTFNQPFNVRFTVTLRNMLSTSTIKMRMKATFQLVNERLLWFVLVLSWNMNSLSNTSITEFWNVKYFKGERTTGINVLFLSLQTWSIHKAKASIKGNYLVNKTFTGI